MSEAMQLLRVLRPSVRMAASATAAVLIVAGVQAATASRASAQEGPSKPPGSEATPEAPEVDPNAPGLKLGDGATLAEPRVLDIKSITESFGTDETGGGTPSEGGDPSDDKGEEAVEPVPTERREVSNSNTKFTLQSDVLFAKNSAKLNSKAHGRLKQIAEEINKQSPGKVNVFGFTDDLGSYDSGVGLSKDRAAAVHEELIKTVKSPGITFNIRGYSEDYPIADNSTEDGRQQNRRVEISFPVNHD